MEFSICGIEIRLKYSFFLVLSIFLLWDQTGWATLVLLSITLHELSHLLAMQLLGVRVIGITLCPFGINIQKEGKPIGYGREALVYLAGPLCNLILAAAGFRMEWQAFTAINLVLGLMQMIPILPMDGGQLLGCLTGKFLSPETADRLSTVIGLLLLTPLAICAIYLFFRKGNFTLLVLCLSLLWRNGRESSQS